MRSELNQELEKQSINKLAEGYLKETKGIPIMLKFAVFKKGLFFDVVDKYGQYFCDAKGKKDANKIETMTACSFIDIGSDIGSDIQITKQILESANILSYAEDLIGVTLYEDIPPNLLKTIHVEWDKEFLSLGEPLY